MSNSENSKRIAKNTFFLYFRMILLMFVSLYTSRIVLQALGVEDFGIYNVVGVFVTMLGFFTSSLTNVTQRYLNLGIGLEDKNTTIKYFKQLGTLLFLFSLITFVLAETIGIWFLLNKLVIPEARMKAAFWVYQFTIVSILCTINQVNFLGAIIAHEKMNIYAYLGIFEALARLIIAYVVLKSQFDHLILYAGLMSFVSIIVFLFHLIYCKINFDICHIGLYWDRTLVKDMAKFISANIFGCFAYAAGVQGTDIIMNLFFGPIVNAAKGISSQIGAAITKFADNIMAAVKPQIIKSYASGNIQYLLSLINKSSKLAFFISAIIAVPIIVHTEPILQWWLKIVPEHTIGFSRLVIIESLANVFITPLWIAASATGNIRRNQIYGRIFNLLSFPISYLFLIIYPNAILAVIIISTIMQYLYLCYCVYDIKLQLQLNINEYIKEVIFPAIIMFCTLYAIGVITNYIWITNSFVYIIIKILLMVIIGILLSYTLMTKGERDMIKGLLIKNKKII